MKKPLLFSLLFIIISNSLNAQPGNDACSGARLITTDSICVTSASQLTGQTLTNSTNQTLSFSSSCSHSGTARDVWYKFVARSQYPVVTISNQGSGWGGIANVRIQLLSGNCSSLNEVACASGATLSPSLTNPLTIGDTFYIRIHKNTSSGLTTNHSFDICVTDLITKGGRMNEVFSRTILSGSGVLNYPWEVTYGADNFLWVTEAKGYKVYRINPSTGAKTTVLDISQFSTFFSAPDNSFNCQFANGSGAQGGLAGLALHPNFMDGTAGETNWVYVSYIRTRTNASYFINSLVRFNYNKNTQRFESPTVICDTLPGSNDHNSQRMIIAPVTKGGTPFLFYASGDMGAGQGSVENITNRPIRSQFPHSYEGKILRFNLDEDDDADADKYDNWIPDDNPYNIMLGKQSAVWNIGIRNNQGFAYDTAANILYGSSHGAYSDDEINILQGFKNYGHPLIIGYEDGNYDGNTNPGTATNNLNISAGAPYKSGNTTYGNSTCPPIGSEATRRAEINASGNGAYVDPLFSGYPGDPSGTGSVRYIWQNTTGANGSWPSEGWSGLDIYTNKVIPGWSKSLVAGGLKWGRLIRLKLGADGESIVSMGGGDTITYFQSTNRYRDLAFAPNGRDIYVIMDNNSATSGPGTNNPVTPACPGCLVKYSFLGYADAGGKSSIPTTVEVTAGTPNTCNQGTQITIDASNNRLWVPITGPDGNIMAEINAMGQNLGVVNSSFYTHIGSTRQSKGFRYLNRNITITPTNTFSSPVKIRLYITKSEFDALAADPLSSITSGIDQLKILKNNDPCGPTLVSSTQEIPVTISSAERQHGTNGYVLQGEVTGFSSFYFGAVNITLPVELITFKASLQNDATLLRWETINENNASHFDVERSLDGRNFDVIGNVKALGGNANSSLYSYMDYEVNNLSATVVYYRLKMADNDGRYTYSPIVSVNLGDIANRVILSPNPTTGDTRLIIASAKEGKAVWKVTDNNGRVVLKQSVHVRRGNNTISLNVSGLRNGLYYLHISGAGLNQSLKLQKL